MNKLHSILVVTSCRCSYYDEKLIKKNHQYTIYFYLCAELIEMNLFYLQAVLYQIVFKSIKLKFTFGFCRAVLFSHYKLTKIAIFFCLPSTLKTRTQTGLDMQDFNTSCVIIQRPHTRPCLPTQQHTSLDTCFSGSFSSARNLHLKWGKFPQHHPKRSSQPFAFGV